METVPTIETRPFAPPPLSIPTDEPEHDTIPPRPHSMRHSSSLSLFIPPGMGITNANRSFTPSSRSSHKDLGATVRQLSQTMRAGVPGLPSLAPSKSEGGFATQAKQNSLRSLQSADLFGGWKPLSSHSELDNLRDNLFAFSSPSNSAVRARSLSNLYLAPDLHNATGSSTTADTVAPRHVRPDGIVALPATHSRNISAPVAVFEEYADLGDVRSQVHSTASVLSLASDAWAAPSGSASDLAHDLSDNYHAGFLSASASVLESIREPATVGLEADSQLERLDMELGMRGADDNEDTFEPGHSQAEFRWGADPAPRWDSEPPRYAERSRSERYSSDRELKGDFGAPPFAQRTFSAPFEPPALSHPRGYPQGHPGVPQRSPSANSAFGGVRFSPPTSSMILDDTTWTDPNRASKPPARSNNPFTH